ncbi:molybdopterin synthase catalytic subunit-like isoform X5 [Schistocerca piceifrons]|uniref:molybdopterin synthase catalytic subunit-like isoform X5 n=1 Tax=Schistocerca piceifrons TaxID=274613 RepID=UPI001F5F5D0A|nr:molybdopterin synthase catalytic subunit-like isoform X5 [Schistocerca piceifrons]
MFTIRRLCCLLCNVNDCLHTVMDDNGEKQIKEAHITQSTNKQPGKGPLHVVIMPTSLTVGKQQKCLLDNRISEPVMTYPSNSTATQTTEKPVHLILMSAPSTADQQLPCTSATKQSERKVLLLPHSIKQPEKASSQSDLTNQSTKKVHILMVTKDRRLTDCNTSGAQYFSGTCDDTSDSRSVLQAKSSKDIDYRIKAFLARKRAELDVQNVEEYCLHIGMNPNVCARVDATVHQHRKRKKRKFEFAPQPEEKEEGTQLMPKDASQEKLHLSVAHPILEERIANAEVHLKLGKPVPKDIYSRLKRIEDRILQLEGISPEYTYDATFNLHLPRPLPKIKRRCTVDELDAKISELQKKFEKKPETSSQKEIVK